MVLLVGVLVPVTMVTSTSVAHADNTDYSLYKAASNASNYFNMKNSPIGKGMQGEWGPIITNPATGGDFLGYGDPQLGANVVGWLASTLSGSSQTITYTSIREAGKTSRESDATKSFPGMLDYAHFGAANASLGLDSMVGGTDLLSRIVISVGGAIMWLLYALAVGVSIVFFLIINVLKYLNPFLWFGQAWNQLNPTFGRWLTDVPLPTQLTQMGTTIKGWYITLVDLSWQVLIPLMLGVLIMGIVMFKSTKRGSKIKNFLIRLVFAVIGVPLIGSLYTGILLQFDDLGATAAGPTRVILSNYVDFEQWMVQNRLAIPPEAVIEWDNGKASSASMMAIRDTAAAINKQAYGGANGPYKDIHIMARPNSATNAWSSSTTMLGDSSLNNSSSTIQTNESNSIMNTFKLIGKVIGAKTITPSDFESGIKGTISGLSDTDFPNGNQYGGDANDKKKNWFEGAYKDANTYGEETEEDGGSQGKRDSPPPRNNPILAVAGDNHLSSSNPGSDTTTFTTPNASRVANCNYTVSESGLPAQCNLSPLAAYNYLNTTFGPDSVTMYSSKNISSDFIRSNHLAVSQVGTGIGQFSYWVQACVTLACLVVLGLWYAVGMLIGSVKRMLSLVVAIPFATLGVLSSIAKVITYTVALILEVLVTLFLYSFVSELLIQVPAMMTGFISTLVNG